MKYGKNPYTTRTQHLNLNLKKQNKASCLENNQLLQVKYI